MKKSYQMLVFSIAFVAIGVLAFVGGCTGHVWHFYTAGLSFILSAILYLTHRSDNANISDKSDFEILISFFRKHIFKNRFILKSGDKVWVNIIQKGNKIQIQQAEIDGFRFYGICYKNHPVKWHHYATGLFYGFGYHSDGYAIVCKSKWHLYPAILIEKIRVKLPVNVALWLHLETGK